MDMPSVPEGCFSLPEAYRYYLESPRRAGRSSSADHQEEAESELIEAFKARDIEALVRRDSSAIDVLPPASWGMEEWPGRIFLSPQINTLSAWAPFNGLVPFVRREAFQKWVYGQAKPAPISVPTEHFDGIAIGRGVTEPPIWSFGVAVLWIMCRSPQTAAEYWPGPLDVALAYTAPGAISFEVAQADLVRRLASGSLKATAVDARGDIRKLEAHEWWHLIPQMDGGNNGLKIRLWRPEGDLGGMTYHDVRLMRDDVLTIWPELRHDALSKEGSQPGEPGVHLDTRSSAEVTIGKSSEIIERSSAAGTDSTEPDPAGAEQFLKRIADAYIAEKGNRITTRDWKRIARQKFDIANHTAVEIWEKMPAGFRGGAGRPKANQVAAAKIGNAS